jgi:ribosome recycling factor
VVNQALLADPTNESLKAKLDDLDINIANMQGQIRETMSQNALENEKLEEYKKSLATLGEQIGNISAQKMSADLLKTLNAKVANLFPTQDDEDVQEVYATNMYRLFLGEYETEESENLTKIIKARRQEYYESVKNMARVYLNTLNDMESSSDRSKNCADALGKADGIDGQQTMQICTDLQNGRVSAGVTGLLLARLRYRATADMQRWTNMYKLRDYTSDPTKFNLDNYIFTKNDLNFNKAKLKLRETISNFKGF